MGEIDQVLQGRLSDIKTKKERADLKLNILLLSDYGLNGVQKTTKIVLDDYLEFNHTQFIIQRGGSCVLVPFALRVSFFYNKTLIFSHDCPFFKIRNSRKVYFRLQTYF